MQSYAPSVLIVEDDLNLLRLYARVLLRAGFEVHHALTLREARLKLEQKHYDLLICDLFIGRERGLDLVSEQREHLAQAGTPVIVVSGQEQLRATCEAIGVEFFLSKPVSNSDLAQLACRLVGLDS